ncbi:MAG TPA: DUF883 family protein [Usitatibacter sp.]|nr:DUF883 family protein [Usitatibacter sp.]
MDVSTDKLVQDLRTVVADAEELLKATAENTGESVMRARARAEESLRSARVTLQNAGVRIEDEVRKHPWQSLGVAACAGLILGVLIARK